MDIALGAASVTSVLCGTAFACYFCKWGPTAQKVDEVAVKTIFPTPEYPINYAPKTMLMADIAGGVMGAVADPAVVIGERLRQLGLEKAGALAYVRPFA